MSFSSLFSVQPTTLRFGFVFSHSFSPKKQLKASVHDLNDVVKKSVIAGKQYC